MLIFSLHRIVDMPTRTISRPNSVRTAGSKSFVDSDNTSFVKTSFHSSHFRTVQSSFKKMIEPIYGDQKNAIVKIKEGLDRTCEVMLKHDNPVGMIVYKNKLQNEYGLVSALELKTLFLFNPNKNSGHGFGSRLFQRIDEVAQEMVTNIIYCTASSKLENSIKCALKNGYKITRVLEQNEDQILYLLIKVL